MFTIHAKTPDDLRNQLVEWLEMMAQREQTDKKMSTGKRHELNCEVRSNTYTSAARFWRDIIIETED